MVQTPGRATCLWERAFSGRWPQGDVGPGAGGQPTRLRATGFLARSLGLISPSRGPVRHLPPPGNSQLSHVSRSCVAARPSRPMLQPGRASRWRRRPARLALARDEWWAAIDSPSPARGAVRGASRLCNVRASYSPLTLRILGCRNPVWTGRWSAWPPAPPSGGADASRRSPSSPGVQGGQPAPSGGCSARGGLAVAWRVAVSSVSPTPSAARSGVFTPTQRFTARFLGAASPT